MNENCVACEIYKSKNICKCKQFFKPKSTFNGYYLNYLVTDTILNKIKNEFFTRDEFEEICFFKEKSLMRHIPRNNNNYILPMGLFAHDNFSIDWLWLNTKRSPLIKFVSTNIQNNIKLKKEQEIVKNKIYKEILNLNNKNSLIYFTLEAECSFGKTVLTIDIINTIGLKAFIITPTKDLAKQWAKEINKFIQNINCVVSLNGVSQLLKDKEILAKCDILCFPSAHLNNLEFYQLLLDNFSIGIFDEQHKSVLKSNVNIQKFMSLTSFPYFISLTATPIKSNQIYFGKIINVQKEINEFKPKTFIKKAFEVSTLKQVLPSEYIEFYDIYNKIKPSDRIRKSLYKKRIISVYSYRQDIIINTILDSMKLLEDKYCIMILTKFVEEIEIYTKILKQKIDDKSVIIDIYANKNIEKSWVYNKANLEQKQKYIIIGTQDHLGTGMDLPSLNILHLTSLSSNSNQIKQFAGRVSRNNNSDIHYIYYYNISYKDISFKNEVQNIKKSLSETSWSIQQLKY